MSKEYTEKQNVQIAQQEYKEFQPGKIENPYRVGDAATIDKDKTVIGYVSEVWEDSLGKNILGLQGYVITKERLPKNPSPSDLAKVSEVTVLYRGSTAPKLTLDPLLANDILQDWAINDGPMAARIIATQNNLPLPSNVKDKPVEKRATLQLLMAARALKETMDKYPNAMVNVDAHSLGSMEGQYSIADLDEKHIRRIKSARFYNGPNVYPILTERQKKAVDSIKGRIVNTFDEKDIVGLAYPRKGSEGAVGVVKRVDSKDVGMEKQHMWGGYQFTSKGDILIKPGSESQFYADLTKAQFADYQLKKNALSSGGYSANEKIFLDSEQASIVSENLKSASQLGHDKMKQLKEEAVEEMRQFYTQTKDLALMSCLYLSPAEVEAILIEEGASEADLITSLETELEDKVSKAHVLAQSYDNLGSQIEGAVAEMLATDAQLAREFDTWKKM